MLKHLLLGLALVAAPAAAQVAGGRAVVATRMAGAPATRLLVVDVAGGGTSVPLGPFPSDARPPLAVAVDPVNLDLLLAVEDGAGTSTVLRLVLSGLSVVSEIPLATLPGRVTDLAVGGPGSVLAAVDGSPSGLYVIPRNGGAAALLVAIADPVALDGFGIGLALGSVGSSGIGGQPPVDPTLHRVDLATGTVSVQTVTGLHTPEITSFADLPTGLPRLFLSHPDGTMSLRTFGPPVALPLTPQLPPGATDVIVTDAGLLPLVLGGQAHPFLKTFDAFSPSAWTLVAGPFPGHPVDVTIAPPEAARVTRFGTACGPGQPMAFWYPWSPRLGTPGFSLVLINAQPQTPAFLGLGLSDKVAFGSLPLPIALPNGCQWHVDPQALFPVTTDVTGQASVALPIPNSPSLDGSIFFIQWIQQQGAAFAVTPAAAVHVRP